MLVVKFGVCVKTTFFTWIKKFRDSIDEIYPGAHLFTASYTIHMIEIARFKS